MSSPQKNSSTKILVGLGLLIAAVGAGVGIFLFIDQDKKKKVEQILKGCVKRLAEKSTGFYLMTNGQYLAADPGKDLIYFTPLQVPGAKWSVRPSATVKDQWVIISQVTGKCLSMTPAGDIVNSTPSFGESLWEQWAFDCMANGKDFKLRNVGQNLSINLTDDNVTQKGAIKGTVFGAIF